MSNTNEQQQARLRLAELAITEADLVKLKNEVEAAMQKLENKKLAIQANIQGEQK